MVGQQKQAARGVKAKSVAATKKAGDRDHADLKTRGTVIVDRREPRLDRRTAADRRGHQIPVATDRRAGQRREKVNRRRQIDPTTCERDYTPDEVEFMSAMDNYKRRSGRMFPTCSEVLEVVKSLGYVKQLQAEPAVLPTVAAPAMPFDMPMLVTS